MDIYDLMTGTRLRLGDPRAGRPNDMQLLDQVCMQIRTVKRFESNTSNAWSLGDLILEDVPDETVYQITTTDFGTPLAMLTWNPSNPSWVPRLIEYCQPQNMVFSYSLPNIAGAFYLPADGSNCTALRWTWYKTDGQPYVEILPPPSIGGAQYKIRYLKSADGVNMVALTASLVSNEDADIVQTRSALGLLATTEWMSPNSKDNRAYNAERRRDLATTLSNDERELRRQFEAAKLVMDGPVMRVRWGGSDYSG